MAILMKSVIVVVVCSVLCGCLAAPKPLAWNVKQLANAPDQTHNLQDSAGFGFRVSTKTLQDITAVYMRLKEVIKHIVDIDAELLIVENYEVNAFAGMRYDKPMIGITTGMVMLLGDDIDLYAALLGHEIAHLAWGHSENRKTFKDITSAVGLVTPLFGAPANLLHLGLTVVNEAYTRDEEREADALGVELMIGAGFDPNAAIRLHEALRRQGVPTRLFFGTHPNSDERIRNIRRIIEENKSKRS
jgi:Zn-dependent protease with chaperone function